MREPYSDYATPLRGHGAFDFFIVDAYWRRSVDDGAAGNRLCVVGSVLRVIEIQEDSSDGKLSVTKQLVWFGVSLANVTEFGEAVGVVSLHLLEPPTVQRATRHSRLRVDRRQSRSVDKWLRGRESIEVASLETEYTFSQLITDDRELALRASAAAGVVDAESVLDDYLIEVDADAAEVIQKEHRPDTFFKGARGG